MAAKPDIGRVTVFGGSGFLGTKIVERLASQDIAVRVAVRTPDKVRLRIDAVSDLPASVKRPVIDSSGFDFPALFIIFPDFQS